MTEEAALRGEKETGASRTESAVDADRGVAPRRRRSLGAKYTPTIFGVLLASTVYLMSSSRDGIVEFVTAAVGEGVLSAAGVIDKRVSDVTRSLAQSMPAAPKSATIWLVEANSESQECVRQQDVALKLHLEVPLKEHIVLQCGDSLESKSLDKAFAEHCLAYVLEKSFGYMGVYPRIYPSVTTVEREGSASTEISNLTDGVHFFGGSHHPDLCSAMELQTEEGRPAPASLPILADDLKRKAFIAKSGAEVFVHTFLIICVVGGLVLVAGMGGLGARIMNVLSRLELWSGNG